MRKILSAIILSTIIGSASSAKADTQYLYAKDNHLFVAFSDGECLYGVKDSNTVLAAVAIAKGHLYELAGVPNQSYTSNDPAAFVGVNLNAAGSINTTLRVFPTAPAGNGYQEETGNQTAALELAAALGSNNTVLHVTAVAENGNKERIAAYSTLISLDNNEGFMPAVQQCMNMVNGQ